METWITCGRLHCASSRQILMVVVFLVDQLGQKDRVKDEFTMLRQMVFFSIGQVCETSDDGSNIDRQTSVSLNLGYKRQVCIKVFEFDVIIKWYMCILIGKS